MGSPTIVGSHESISLKAVFPFKCVTLFFFFVTYELHIFIFRHSALSCLHHVNVCCANFTSKGYSTHWDLKKHSHLPRRNCTWILLYVLMVLNVKKYWKYKYWEMGCNRCPRRLVQWKGTKMPGAAAQGRSSGISLADFEEKSKLEDRKIR